MSNSEVFPLDSRSSSLIPSTDVALALDTGLADGALACPSGSQGVARQFIHALSGSLVTSFFDEGFQSDTALQVSLLVNDQKTSRKVLNDLTRALETCEACAISVAFVTWSGIVPLIPALDDLERRGIPVRVLTCDYQQFTEPNAVRRLMRWSNIELRFFRTEEKGSAGSKSEGFHTKGYFFRQGDLCRFLIGSSNLTQAALTTSHEWNLSLVSRETGGIAQKIMAEFETLWQAPQTHPAAEVIDAYEAEYLSASQAQRDWRAWCKQNRRQTSQVAPQPTIHPNAMQAAFVERLLAIRDAGGQKALLISATGTGKTYAAAFAAAKLAPKRLLFVVHREQIARQALESFRRVLGERDADGNERTFGLFSGNEQNLDADFVFATVQSTSQKLKDIAPDAFDLVIIDEAHHTGAQSYRKIMDSLRPKFWLGLTGTPDRTDGFDVYALFDHAIAGEIRLEEALENNLLTPFHYFGLNALEVDGVALNPDDFARLGDEERWRQMMRQSEHYGWSGERRRALLFVGTLEEAALAAKYLNAHGYPTAALSGADSMDVREAMIHRLEYGVGEERLEFIVTVDVFNEGVDIPSVNQVILMRETKSAIVFIQQLGRGLRRCNGKDFVVVIDFIGAWETNFLIAMALSGDRSGVKDQLRRFVAVGANALPGASTVHFDEISKQRIFRAIDTAKLSSIKRLKEAYQQLRARLGAVPTLMDFEAQGSIDPVKFMTKEAGGSYYSFLVHRMKEPAYTVRLSAKAETMLAWLSQKLGKALRPSEAIILDEILQGHEALDRRLEARLRDEWQFVGNDAEMARHLSNVGLVLTNNFERTEDAKKPWADCVFINPDTGGGWSAADGFLVELKAPHFKHLVRELVDFILARAKKRFETYPTAGERAGFLRVGDAYTYEEVARLLDWQKNVSAQLIGGYWYEKEGDTLSIFVNYAKAQDAIQYHDRFVSPKEILTLSKLKRQVDSVDAQRMMQRGIFANTRILLFLRRDKEDGESKAFYCLGGMQAASKDPIAVTLEVMDKDGALKSVPAFEVLWQLEHAVDSALYAYLTAANA